MTALKYSVLLENLKWWILTEQTLQIIKGVISLNECGKDCSKLMVNETNGSFSFWHISMKLFYELTWSLFFLLGMLPPRWNHPVWVWKLSFDLFVGKHSDSGLFDWSLKVDVDVGWKLRRWRNEKKWIIS